MVEVVPLALEPLPPWLPPAMAPTTIAAPRPRPIKVKTLALAISNTRLGGGEEFAGGAH